MEVQPVVELVVMVEELAAGVAVTPMVVVPAVVVTVVAQVVVE